MRRMPGRLLHVVGQRLAGTRPSQNSSCPLLQAQSWQDWSTFLLDGIEVVRIEPQGLKDSGSDLRGFDKAGHCAGMEVGIRHQQHDVGIVVRETAVFRLFLRASGVDYADVRLHDDIWSPRVAVGRYPGRV